MRKKVFLIISGLIILILILFGSTIKEFSPIFLQFIFNKDIELKKTNNAVNVLLLGIGGGVHEWPNLSDTIIFSSINLGKNTISLISIPRDLWMPDLQRKINTAYAIGEGKRKGGGLILARANAEKLLNQKIDYIVVVNFDAFTKGVDLIGGISVDVENVLDDYEYPIEGKQDDSCGFTNEEIIALATVSSQLEAFPCRYKHLHFDKGLQAMNGEEALAFVRSRHAEGDEGTDFARSRRQEKIIAAFKDKLISAETIFNP